MTIAFAVVAHEKRRTQAETLAHQLGAHIAWDNGTHGEGANHDRAWQSTLEHSPRR